MVAQFLTESRTTSVQVTSVQVETRASDVPSQATPQTDVLYQQQHLGTTGITGGQTFHEIAEDIKSQFHAVGQWLRSSPLAIWHRVHAP